MKEIILIGGFTAAGKSTIVASYISQGYHRINADLTGGGMPEQLTLIEKAI